LDLLTLPTYYPRSRRYLRFGLGHLLMYVFGRFGAVRSLMVWRYSQRTSTPVSITSSSLATTANVDDVVHKICQDGFCNGLNLRRDVVEQLLTFSSLGWRSDDCRHLWRNSALTLCLGPPYTSDNV
jgi:hypothetical protein